MPTNKPMKRLSLYLFLIFFTLQTPSQADDIRDLEIEGMSIGDSLLNKFSEEKINNSLIIKFPKENFYIISIHSSKFDTYDGVQVGIKKDDLEYILHGVSGVIIYKNDIQNCYKEMKKIVTDIYAELKSFYKKDHGRLDNPIGADPYGGTYNLVTLQKKNKDRSDRVQISCNDWSKKSNIVDSLKIEIYSEELAYFVDYLAYK